MRFLLSFFLIVLLLSAHGAAADMLVLPGSFKAGAMVRVEGPKTWTFETMYEHVNGEAELLKRYGAIELAYATYEGSNGDYLSTDILDMGAPVNAFGLYSLYAGCDGDEYSTSGATVLSGDFTSYAIFDRYFMRIDFEAKGGKEAGKSLVDKFLSDLADALPAAEPLPLAVRHLKKLARKPCEVGYHPEHVDYDLETGPGYTWTGPDGGTYYIHLLASDGDAEAHAANLRMAGAPTVLVLGSMVSWTRTGTEKAATYLKEVLRKVEER